MPKFVIDDLIYIANTAKDAAYFYAYEEDISTLTSINVYDEDKKLIETVEVIGEERLHTDLELYNKSKEYILNYFKNLYIEDIVHNVIDKIMYENTKAVSVADVAKLDQIVEDLLEGILNKLRT